MLNWGVLKMKGILSLCWYVRVTVKDALFGTTDQKNLPESETEVRKMKMIRTKFHTVNDNGKSKPRFQRFAPVSGLLVLVLLHGKEDVRLETLGSLNLWCSSFWPENKLTEMSQTPPSVHLKIFVYTFWSNAFLISCVHWFLWMTLINTLI